MRYVTNLPKNWTNVMRLVKCDPLHDLALVNVWRAVVCPVGE